MKEYDERQLNIMIQKINSFKSGDLFLSYLINDLEALLNVLEEKDDNWEAEFRTSWLDLEVVYALALDDNRTTLDLEDQRIIAEALVKLEDLVNEKLQSK